jgi:hypothetical protein
VTPAEYIKIKSDEARAAGLCPSCRWRIPKPGRVTCQYCIDKAQDRRRAWRDAGLCVDCVRPHGSDSRRCHACKVEHRKLSNEREKAKRRASLAVRAPNRCGVCDLVGHNARTCKWKAVYQ